MRLIAHLLSVLFHPLFMIIYILIILIGINPYSFALQEQHDKIVFIVYTLVNSLVIPILAIFIMKLLGFVKTFEMKDSKERIGPMIVIGTLYLWLFINFKNNSSVPDIFNSFLLGSVIAVFASFFINNFTKISLHMVGAGGLIIALFLMKINVGYDHLLVNFMNIFSFVVSLDLVIMGSVIIAGSVATARLYLEAHIPAEIYGGLIVGFLSQVIAYNIIF